MMKEGMLELPKHVWIIKTIFTVKSFQKKKLTQSFLKNKVFFFFGKLRGSKLKKSEIHLANDSLHKASSHQHYPPSICVEQAS